jgi:hypothetical protein
LLQKKWVVAKNAIPYTHGPTETHKNVKDDEKFEGYKAAYLIFIESEDSKGKYSRS